MKRLFLLLAFCPLLLSAQSSIDPAAGLCFTSWKLKNPPSGSVTTNANSYMFGFAWRSRSEKLLNWCGNFFIYGKAGHLHLIRPFGTIDDMEVNIRYFGFSFTPEWHIHTSPVEMVISAGPFASGMIGGKVTGTTGTEVLDDDPRDYFNRLDVGLMLGLGAHYPVSEKMMLIGQYRFLNAIPDMTGILKGGGKLNAATHEISVGVGFLFEGKGK